MTREDDHACGAAIELEALDSLLPGETSREVAYRR